MFWWTSVGVTTIGRDDTLLVCGERACGDAATHPRWTGAGLRTNRHRQPRPGCSNVVVVIDVEALAAIVNGDPGTGTVPLRMVTVAVANGENTVTDEFEIVSIGNEKAVPANDMGISVSKSLLAPRLEMGPRTLTGTFGLVTPLAKFPMAFAASVILVAGVPVVMTFPAVYEATSRIDGFVVYRGDTG